MSFLIIEKEGNVILSKLFPDSSLNLSKIKSANSLLRNKNPRYLGSKTISQKYNTYTIRDLSYGQTAAIDLNSLRFAYFSEIVEISVHAT